MKWTNDLATGVAEIDEQHRSLFDWLGQLECAAADQRAMTAAYCLTRLGQYTRSHFDAEEALMAGCAYPGLANHRAEHDAFREQLRELQAASLNRDITGDAIELLRSWLVTHIMVSDMARTARPTGAPVPAPPTTGSGPAAGRRPDRRHRRRRHTAEPGTDQPDRA
jgi:hemerythrin